VIRGLDAHCTACGRRRSPFSGAAVNVAGRPTRFGGSVARVAGWMTLAFGLSVALVLGLVLQALFPAGFVGFAVGGVIGLITIFVGVLLLVGARKLHASGDSAERDTRAKAIFALAAHRGGVITARDAAAALRMPVDQADALLTSLAKEESERVTLELDDNGGIYYRFPESIVRRGPSPVSSWAPRQRVAAPDPRAAAAPAEEEMPLEELEEPAARPNLRADPR
jgi:hypothetical protein